MKKYTCEYKWCCQGWVLRVAGAGNAADELQWSGVMPSDFNAETGLARNSPTVVGPHGSGSDNDSSRRLLNFCISANLRICGSWFCRKKTFIDSPGCQMITKRQRRLTMSWWTVAGMWSWNVEFIENRNSTQITDQWLLLAAYKVEKAVLHQPTKFMIRCFRATYTWGRISIPGGYPEPFHGTR